MTHVLPTDHPIEPADIPADVVPETSSQQTVPMSNEFDYHPMPVLVPIALLMAVVGLTGFIGAFGVMLAILAIPLAVWAIFKVRNSEGFYSGGTVAKVALGLALIGAVGGFLMQRHAYQTEVPEGFARLNFNYDVSKKPVVETLTGVQPSAEVEDLEGKKVFLKGYMYPTRKTEDLKGFLLLKDTGECCFGGDPAVTDMIGIKMKGDLTADHFEQQLVSVAGTFRINRNYGSVRNDGNPEPLYLLDAVHFEPSRTMF